MINKPVVTAKSLLCTKVDKLRFCCDRLNIDLTTLEDIEASAKEQFYGALKFTKGKFSFIEITPTRLKRENEQQHNLQRPCQLLFSEALNNTFLLETEVQNRFWCSNIHIAIDVVMPRPIQNYIQFLGGLKYRFLVPNTHSTSLNNKSLYLAPAKIKKSAKNYTERHLIKFYDKSQEYIDKHNTSIVHLNESLSEDEINILGEAYNRNEHTVDLSRINLLRIEVELKGAKFLESLANHFEGNRFNNRLTYNRIIQTLDRNTFKNIIENYLIEHLNKYIFSQFTENVTENTSDSYTKFAAEFLINSGNIYKYKNIFKEFIHIDKNLERNFSNLVTKSKQYVSENDLFNELIAAIESSLEFNSSLSEAPNTEPVQDNMLQYNSVTGMVKKSWPSFFILLNNVVSLCKAYCNSLKQILLIYPVPIWDDS